MVIPMEEACGKYRAADYARKELDPDFLLIARTDARGAHGGTLDDAIARANAYLDAGADMAFVEGPVDVAEVKRICAEVKGPILYNQTGISPRFTQRELQELGIAITIAPGALLRTTMQACYDLAMAMREDGPEAEKNFAKQFQEHPIGDFHTFAGFDQIMEWEREFLGEAELAKYADSVGHQPKAAQ
jgi:2-methylisocitrate lyase-like PEP mutase family enzyme